MPEDNPVSNILQNSLTIRRPLFAGNFVRLSPSSITITLRNSSKKLMKLKENDLFFTFRGQ